MWSIRLGAGDGYLISMDSGSLPDFLTGQEQLLRKKKKIIRGKRTTWFLGKLPGSLPSFSYSSPSLQQLLFRCQHS